MQWGRHEGLDGRYGKHVEPLPQWGNRWGRPCGSGTSTQLSLSSSSIRKCSEYPANFYHNRRILGQLLQAHDLVGVPGQRAGNQLRRNTIKIDEKLPEIGGEIFGQRHNIA